MDLHLSKSCKFSTAVTITNGAAGVTAVNGNIVDMSGFGGLLVIIPFGTIVAGAVTSIKFQHGDQSNLSDAADIAGTGQTIADTADDTVFISDIIRPSKRYLRVVISRGTQNATFCAIYQQYNSDNNPPTQPAGITTEVFVDPVGGTA